MVFFKILLIVISTFILMVKPVLANLTLPRFSNPGQGLFQCHAGNNIGAEYVKGGGIVLYWSDFQSTNPNSLDDSGLNNFLNILRQMKTGGKKAYFQFMMRGTKTSFPSFIQDIAWIQASDGWYPSPWDQKYKTHLRKLLTLLNAEIDKHDLMDVIEYVEPAVGGRWLATEIYVNEPQLNNWVVAAGCSSGDYGCLGTRFTQTVNEIVDIHAESFPKLSLMLIGGSCRYPECNYSGLNQLLNKYGMRLMYKKAGIGHRSMDNCGLADAQLSPLCGNSPKTKCGQEPWAGSVNCEGPGKGFDPNGESCHMNYQDTYDYSLLREAISYYCMYGIDLICGRDSSIPVYNRDVVASKLGAQIKLIAFNFPQGEKRIGEQVSISSKWQNLGAASLVAPLKTGIKWTPSSYKLFLEFVKGSERIHYQEIEVNPPTNSWIPIKHFVEKDVGFSFNVSGALGGDNDDSVNVYKVYIGLTDPNGENQRFALINTDTNNDVQNRRYLAASSFSVKGKKTTEPTATQGVAPSITPNITSSIAPIASCICQSDNTCHASCVYDKFASGVTYINPIKCSFSSDLYSSVPSQDNKNNWCRTELKTKGDADNSREVNILDYYYYVHSKAGGKLSLNVNADFNGDGIVDENDRSVVVKMLKSS